MITKVLTVFVVAFGTNYLYEHVHAPLYLHYQGGAISEAILLHATLVDALIITLIVFPFLYAARLKRLSWVIIPIGFAIATGIEWWALGTARWAYGPSMPIIPLLGTGLTPTIQLGLLGYVSYLSANWFARHSSSRGG